MEFNREILTTIIEKVRQSCFEDKIGGPFGAFVFKDDEIIGVGVNSVLGLNDPTAHAEVMAIRDACKRLGTHDLTGCEIYATGFPCPMCMSAIIWANIKKVYYSADYKDAQDIGFRDSYIYNFIRDGQKDVKVLELNQVDKSSIIELYQDFKQKNGEIY